MELISIGDIEGGVHVCNTNVTTPSFRFVKSFHSSSHSSFVDKIAISKNHFATCATNVILWSLSSLKRVWNKELQMEGVCSLCFNQNGSVLAIGCYEGKIILCNVEDGSDILFISSDVFISIVIFDRDSFLYNTLDAIVSWNMETHEKTFVHGGFTKFTAKNSWIAACNPSGVIELFSNGIFKIEKKCHSSSILDMVFSKNGLLTAGFDGYCILWSLKFHQIHIFAHPCGGGYNFRNCVISNDESFVVTGSHENVIRIWKTPSFGLEVVNLGGAKNYSEKFPREIFSIAICSSNQIFLGLRDGSICICRRLPSPPKFSLFLRDWPISSSFISLDHTKLAVVSACRGKVFEIPSQKLLWEGSVPSAIANAIGISLDSKSLMHLHHVRQQYTRRISLLIRFLKPLFSHHDSLMIFKMAFSASIFKDSRGARDVAKRSEAENPKFPNVSIKF